MRRVLLAVAVSAGLSSGSGGAAALAQSTPGVSAPGNSGLTEYSESVPSGGGDRPTGRGGNGGASGGGGSSSGAESSPGRSAGRSTGGGTNTSRPGVATLSPAARRALDAQGSAGQALKELVAGSPADRAEPVAGRSGNQSQNGGSSGAGGDVAGSTGDANGVSTVLARAVAGGGRGGMGVVLPVLLSGSLFGAAALMLRRRLG